jgi:hypothetical protein
MADQESSSIGARLMPDSLVNLPSLTTSEAPTPGWTRPLNQINPQNPAQVAQEISRRNENADIVRDRVPNFGGINVLGPDQQRQIAQALTQGDPANAKQLVDALRLLQPDDYRATVGSETVSKAIAGMASSKDEIDAAP